MVSIDALTVEFGGTTLFRDISFVINPKDRIALMGKNGAGKSTLLKILAGVRPATRGSVTAPKDCTICYLARDIETEDEVRLAQLQRIDEAMACLKDQQRKVVSLVHGLDGKPRTLTEASQVLGISQPRTGIIYRTAMDHLRTALRSRPLTAYLSRRPD